MMLPMDLKILEKHTWTGVPGTVTFSAPTIRQHKTAHGQFAFVNLGQRQPTHLSQHF